MVSIILGLFDILLDACDDVEVVDLKIPFIDQYNVFPKADLLISSRPDATKSYQIKQLFARLFLRGKFDSQYLEA